MKNELRIPLANGNEIVAAISCDPNYPDIAIGICDGDCWVQDICIVRPHKDWSLDEDLVRSSSDVDCIVFADELSEDYTHKFVIKQYEEEE